MDKRFESIWLRGPSWRESPRVDWAMVMVMRIAGYTRPSKPSLAVVADIPSPKIWAAAGLDAGLMWRVEGGSLPQQEANGRYDENLRMAVPIEEPPSRKAQLINVRGVNLESREINLHHWRCLADDAAERASDCLAKARSESDPQKSEYWCGEAFVEILRGAAEATKDAVDDSDLRWQAYITMLEQQRYTASVWFERDRQNVCLTDNILNRRVVDLWDSAVDEAFDDGFLTPPRGVSIHNSGAWLVPLTDYAFSMKLLKDFRIDKVEPPPAQHMR